MCGIAAFFAYRSSAPPPRREELDAVVARMIPRGPDAGGTWISEDGRVGLGSRRLAIIDLSDEGTQPMWDSARELAIVFNGEIYNYAELRASLVRGGARFHSHTDTEVLLELYRRDGEGMLELLRGMFAFAIWDTRTRRMFVARDPYGIKPLYIADDGATMRIASEVKALLAGGGVSDAIDPAGAAGFFLTGSVPEPFTIRRDIRAIEAGTAFFVEEEVGRGDVRRHYSIADIFRGAVGRSEGVASALVEPELFLREFVDESVRHHLVSDVPVGVFLSAGIDSSAIARLAAKHGALHTFTLSFPEFSEAPLAERFAKELGSKHVTRNVEREEFLADLPRIFERMDQPTIDGVNTWFISKAVHEAGIKVALSGVGGDEMFGSYPSFRNVPRVVSHPRLARTALALRRHPKARMGEVRTYGSAYLLQRGLFLPHELPEILGEAVAREGVERLSLADRFDAVLEPDPLTPFGRVATLESSLYMRNQLLRDADWASMAHSVEVRTPLVDAWLLRQIAPALLRGEGKALLAAPLPPYLRDRPKTGFFVPMKEWLDLPPDGTSTRMRMWARRVWEAFA
jgi:asparagine synthase (glutamine-hydrolysing)